MEKTVYTKKELKAAIKDNVDTIIIGDEKRAKKIFKIRNPIGSVPTVNTGSLNVNSGSAAAGELTTAAVALIISLTAIVILGAGANNRVTS